MSERSIGLIGGLGVGAAVHYYKELAKAHDAMNAPMSLVMVHADMPRMVRWAEAGDARPMAEYLAGLIGQLRAAGATIAVIPAVTPHLCIADLLPISPLPVVNMLETAGEAVRAAGFRRVALFGTRFTVNSALFNALHDVKVADPSPDEVDQIHRIYFQLASTGAGGHAERNELTALAHALIAREHLDGIVLAGTDLAIIFNESNTTFPHVDCARAHLDAIMRSITGRGYSA